MEVCSLCLCLCLSLCLSSFSPSLPSLALIHALTLALSCSLSRNGRVSVGGEFRREGMLSLALAHALTLALSCSLFQVMGVLSVRGEFLCGGILPLSPSLSLSSFSPLPPSLPLPLSPSLSLSLLSLSLYLSRSHSPLPLPLLTPALSCSLFQEMGASQSEESSWGILSLLSPLSVPPHFPSLHHSPSLSLPFSFSLSRMGVPVWRYALPLSLSLSLFHSLSLSPLYCFHSCSHSLSLPLSLSASLSFALPLKKSVSRRGVQMLRYPLSLSLSLKKWACLSQLEGVPMWRYALSLSLSLSLFSFTPCLPPFSCSYSRSYSCSVLLSFTGLNRRGVPT